MVRAFAADQRLHLPPKVVRLSSGARVQVDGFCRAPGVICEAFAHLGGLKDGQRKKLARDVLKIVWVERALGGEWRKVLLVAGQPAETYLTGASWLAAAVRDLRIEVHRLELPQETTEALLGAQARQHMVNQ